MEIAVSSRRERETDRHLGAVTESPVLQAQVQRLARANRAWGDLRIQGALMNLGYRIDAGTGPECLVRAPPRPRPPLTGSHGAGAGGCRV
jgi:hypothetical protein